MKAATAWLLLKDWITRLTRLHLYLLIRPKVAVLRNYPKLVWANRIKQSIEAKLVKQILKFKLS